MWGTSLFWLHALLPISFVICRFLCLTPTFDLLWFYLETFLFQKMVCVCVGGGGGVLVTQETRLRHIKFTFFLPWISWVIRIVSSWYFALLLIHSWIACVRLLFSSILATFERERHQRYSIKKCCKIAKLTEKYLWQSKPETLLRKRLQHRYFSVIFTKCF